MVKKVLQFRYWPTTTYADATVKVSKNDLREGLETSEGSCYPPCIQMLLVDETTPASGSKKAKRLSQILVKSKLNIFFQKFDDPRKDQRMNDC